MKDKKVKMANILVGICLLVIIILLILMYNASILKNNLQNKVIELEKITEENNNVNENTNNKDDKILFSELMNSIYPKKINDNSKEYIPMFIGTNDFMITKDISENIINIQGYRLSYYQLDNKEKTINVNIFNEENNIDKNYTISGINEEVVSIVVLPFEADIIPNYIYFLTREGNIYYLKNDNTIDITNLNATKIESINNVISITKMEVIDDNSMHSYVEVVASTYKGEYKILNKYINN